MQEKNAFERILFYLANLTAVLFALLYCLADSAFRLLGRGVIGDRAFCV